MKFYLSILLSFVFLIHTSNLSADFDNLFKDNETPLSVEETPKEKAPVGDIENGKKLFQSCIACHGSEAQGMAPLKSPPLAGQKAWYLKHSLKKFMNGIRGYDPVKNPQAGLMTTSAKQFLKSEKDIDDVVAFIHTLKKNSVIHTLGKGDTNSGEEFFSTACIQCHGEKAQGLNPLGNINAKGHGPTLSILPDWYIKQQIKNFQTGARGKHPKDKTGKHMHTMSMLLTNDKTLMNVIEYLKTFNKK